MHRVGFLVSFILLSFVSWSQEAGMLTEASTLYKKGYAFLENTPFQPSVYSPNSVNSGVNAPSMMKSKKVIRKFAIDSPFGTLLGPGTENEYGMSSDLQDETVKKNYRLMLCLTGVGLRIDL